MIKRILAIAALVACGVVDARAASVAAGDAQTLVIRTADGTAI